VIGYEMDGGRFSYRVVGVCVHDGHILLHRSDQDDFWSLPGGKGELMETSAETIRREIHEELGCEARVERPLWIVENFFTSGAQKFHEIAFYYQVTIEQRVIQEIEGRIARGEEPVHAWEDVELELDALPE
jgi:8-oxo-dGTP pyrophosphatase MutT (NUDIX family)